MKLYNQSYTHIQIKSISPFQLSILSTITKSSSPHLPYRATCHPFTIIINNKIKRASMNHPGNINHFHSQTGFVLVNGNSKEERPLRWQWLTQRNPRQPSETHEENLHPRLSYSEKKRILSGLEYPLRRTSSFKIKHTFTVKQQIRAPSTASCKDLRNDKKLQPFIYLNCNSSQKSIPAANFGIDSEEMKKLVLEAATRRNKILGIISVRRMGLRYRLQHTFVEYSLKQKGGEGAQLKQLSDKVRQKLKEYRQKEKELYYFSVDNRCINNYKDILGLKLNIVIVDSSPKVHFTQDLWAKIQILAKGIQDLIDQCEAGVDFGTLEDQLQGQQQELYDHQKIKNVKEYVDKLSENPEFQLKKETRREEQLLSWYQQKYTEAPPSDKKDSDKNLLFQSKTHYPKEIVDKKLLNLASQRVESLPITNNRHQFMKNRLDLMMEQVRRDQVKQSLRKPKDRLLQAPLTKKDMLSKLDKKNNLLATQNIPYLIQKYGLNRFELYNLYNLYKSFEKIAVLRDPTNENAEMVAQKGIDRQTFEVGLKGLDMNPGDQLIKGICYFGDFISWQQFIKIISISLRKTPEEKLTAILKGISSFDNGYLSRHQIGMMIGNSLHKLFDHEEQQLKEYFTNMAMAELDSEGSGKVSVQVMKSKVLGEGSGNLSMVSFLILNT